MYGGTPTFWKRELWDSCFQNPSESSVLFISPNKHRINLMITFYPWADPEGGGGVGGRGSKSSMILHTPNALRLRYDMILLDCSGAFSPLIS